MRYNLFGCHELLKRRCFRAESKLMLFFFPFAVTFSSPSPWQGSSASTTVHEQRSFERKAEEDDGKVSFLSAISFQPSLLHVAPAFSQMMFQFERKMPTRVGSVGAARYLNRWHPEDRACERVTMETGRMTDTSRIRLLSCLLFPPPTPTPSPHNLPGTHMLRFRSAERRVLPLC